MYVESKPNLRERTLPELIAVCEGPDRPPDISPKCPILNSGFWIISVAWILANFEAFPAHYDRTSAPGALSGALWIKPWRRRPSQITNCGAPLVL